ncbi:DivIVA domain-containing protein [Candidatus Mycoplasma pogonae]
MKKEDNDFSSIIINKKFNFELNGYNALEVDEFLDYVNQKFVGIQKQNQALKEEIIILQNAYEKIEQDYEVLEMHYKNLKSKK